MRLKRKSLFKLGDVVRTNTGYWFQIDKMGKPNRSENEYVYYEVGGQGAIESVLKLADKDSREYKYYHKYEEFMKAPQYGL